MNPFIDLGFHIVHVNAIESFCHYDGKTRLVLFRKDRLEIHDRIEVYDKDKVFFERIKNWGSHHVILGQQSHAQAPAGEDREQGDKGSIDGSIPEREGRGR